MRTIRRLASLFAGAALIASMLAFTAATVSAAPGDPTGVSVAGGQCHLDFNGSNETSFYGTESNANGKLLGIVCEFTTSASLPAQTVKNNAPCTYTSPSGVVTVFTKFDVEVIPTNPTSIELRCFTNRTAFYNNWG